VDRKMERRAQEDPNGIGLNEMSILLGKCLVMLRIPLWE
jgi:hypothetical protein